jgi:hypothetical protein
MIFYKIGARIGLYHPLDGITNIKQKLCLFTPLKMGQEKKALAFT